MKLKSRGLGRKELVLDFREYEVVSDGKEILVVGTIREPVTWDFSIRICEDDLPGVIRFASQRLTLRWLFRALFRRRRQAHWSESPSEHLAESKTRLAATRERISAEEDAAAWGEAPAPRRRPASTSGRRLDAAHPAALSREAAVGG